MITPFPFGLFQKKAFTPRGHPDRLSGPHSTAAAVAAGVAVGRTEQALSRVDQERLTTRESFAPGDDSRAIHWLYRARTAKPMIGNQSRTNQHNITLALLTASARDEEDRTFERALSIAAS